MRKTKIACVSEVATAAAATATAAETLLCVCVRSSDICLVLVDRDPAAEGVERNVLLNGRVKKNLDLAHVCLCVKT